MSFLRVNFEELYQRHLCRHSQYGINVEHLATVVGTYLAVLGILYWISTGIWWAPLVPVVPYFALLMPNLPIRLTAVLLISIAILFGMFYLVVRYSPLPIWLNGLNVVVIFALYKLQAVSHKFYTIERDMTEFNKKYPKGWPLFALLSLYELPLLLNYLVFDKASWSQDELGDGATSVNSGHSQEPRGNYTERSRYEGTISS